MVELTYFNQNVAFHPSNWHLAGFEKFSKFFQLYGSATIAFHDRTGTIRTPLRTLTFLPIPAYKKFDRTFEDLCDARARELLARSEKLGVSIYAFWSGGIDSTLLLISLLKAASPIQKQNIVVLMTQDSIAENPNFYRDHVYGKLRTESAAMFSYIIGSKKIMVIGGEGNDQLFGSDIMAKLITRFGEGIIHKPYDRAMFEEYWNDVTKEPEITNFYLDQFERLARAAPMPIVSTQDFTWWVNFTTKWQSVFIRMVSYVAARNAENIKNDYLGVYYDHFFATEAFQLWSMNNLDKKIKDSWRTYKWVCKDIIYDYTKDAEYRDNKLKAGSLHGVLVQRSPYNFIDSEFTVYNELDPREYHNADNDFL